MSLLKKIGSFFKKIFPKSSEDNFPEKVRKGLTTHYRTKLVVVLLSLLLWFYVVTEDEYTHVVNVPIRVINLKPGKIIENDYPKEAKVLFWGKGKQLLGLMLENDIELVINLKNVNHKIGIKLKKENIPQHNISIEPLRIIEPDSITIQLANLVEKKIPVKPQLTIQTIPGYTVVGMVQVEPESVVVRGPEKEMAKIEFLGIEDARFEQVKRGFSRKILLKPFTNSKIEMLADKVTITVDVQKLMEKVIARVPVSVQNLPPGTRVIVMPPIITLTLQGGVKALANVTDKEIQVYIDYQRKRRTNEIGYPAIIKTPPGIELRNANPKTFKIVLDKETNDDPRY